MLLNDDYEQLSSRALNTGLLGGAINLLASGGQGWGRAIANGLAGGLQGYAGTFQNAAEQKLLQQRMAQQEEENAMRRQQFDMQKSQQQREFEAQQRRQQAIDGVIGQMPPEQQAAFRAFPELAQEQLKRKFMPQLPKVSDVSPEKYTPESVARFTQSGNYADLVPMAEPEKPTSMMQEYKAAVDQGFKGTLFDYQAALKRAGASSTNVNYGAPMAGVDANGNPVFFQPSKNGGAPAIVPGVMPQDSVKQPTEAQAKAGTFHSQMVSASKELDALEKEGKYNPSTFSNQLATGLASGAGNLIVGAEAQRARQAQNQWAEAFLRVKTGAAATKDEIKLNVETFFPQPGEDAATVEQKRRARAQAEADVAAMKQKPSNILPRNSTMPASSMDAGGWSAKRKP